MKRTYVALVFDKSGSMNNIRNEAVAAGNSMIATIRDRSLYEKQETLVTVITFDSRVTVDVQPTPAVNVPNFSILPQGQTALLDAVGKAVEVLKAQPGARSKDTSYLVTVITDGGENASFQYNARSLNTLMGNLQASDRWTFAFQVPRGAGFALSRDFGVPVGNIREWDATSVGTREMAIQSNAGFTNYFSDRAKGLNATRNFYAPVTTDLSQVTKTVVNRKLDNLTSEFKVLDVKAEAKIKDFIEAKTRKAYVTGEAYYMLMKSEKVQPTKEVLLVDKKTGVVYGGYGARDIIGLPDSQHARVTPGNHSNYDIYVQSTSVNRILPRGTKVLVKK